MINIKNRDNLNISVYVLSALFLVWCAFFSVEREVRAQTFIHYTPYIILNNYIDKQGDQIQISGFMFSPNESVNITFYNLPIANKTVVADTKGNFAVNFLIGNVPSDKYTISVIGSTSNIKTNATFYVTGYYPLVVPSSYYGF